MANEERIESLKAQVKDLEENIVAANRRADSEKKSVKIWSQALEQLKSELFKLEK